MMFKPGDLAWLRYWFDDWDGCSPGWRLAFDDGQEVVLTIVEAPVKNGFENMLPDSDSRVIAHVVDCTGREITMPLTYLVDREEAERMRAHG